MSESDDADVEYSPPSYERVEKATRKAVKRYFKAKGPDWVQRILIAAAILLPCVALSLWFDLPREWLKLPALLGCGGFFAGIVFDRIYALQASRAEVDEVVRSELERSQDLALRRAGITKDDLRVEQGCVFRNSLKKDSDKKYGGAFRAHKGNTKDYKLRWTPQEFTRVNFGQDQLFIYHVAIDLTTGQAFEEVTREIAYRDIVSVETNGERVTKPILSTRKLLKAGRYWASRGGVISGTTLITDGEQTVTLRLRSGEDVLLARWVGIEGPIQPDEVQVNNQATAHLTKQLRELRQDPVRVRVAPRVVRH